MRKSVYLVALFVILVLLTAGCNKTAKVEYTPESPVTTEQVNTGSQYVARAFVESLYTDNRDLFVKCYPDGLPDKMGEASGVDVFDSLKNTAHSGETYTGTASVSSREYSAEFGFDLVAKKREISSVTGIGYSDIDQVVVEKVLVTHANTEGTVANCLYFVVYRTGETWYLFDSCSEGNF